MNITGKGGFKKGQCGNPDGRPKNKLAPIILRETRDGQELIDQALSVLRDKKAGLRDRAEARCWLADRGWGKSAQPIGQDGDGLSSMLDLMRKRYMA